MPADIAAVKDLFEAYTNRSPACAQEIGERLSANGGFKLMADTVDRLEEETGDVCIAAWVSRRWTGIEYAHGRFWA